MSTEEHVLGVHDSGDGVEPRLRLDVLVDEKCLRHRGRIGQARRLDNDGVEAARRAGLALHEALEHPDQVAADRTADAAIVHLEHFLVRADDELAVDADLAELVDDDGVAAAVVFGEDAVQQSGLAGAEVAGQHSDGDLGHDP
jgi:hypothetical protein